MKNMKWFPLVFVLFSSLFLASCEGEIEPIGSQTTDPTGPIDPTNPTGGVFKVDYNGATRTATSTVVYLSGGNINISAVMPGGAGFSFVMDGNATGSYDLDDENNWILFGTSLSVYSSSNFATGLSSGNFTVTEIDETNKTISGTFHFVGYGEDETDIIEFTNGSFTDLPYVTENPTGDVVTATINGQPYEGVDTTTAVVSAGGGPEYAVINSEAVDSTVLNIQINTSLTPGTYALGTIDAIVSYNTVNDGFPEDATTGSITITSISANHVTGTFTATVSIDGTDYQITNGIFDFSL